MRAIITLALVSGFGLAPAIAEAKGSRGVSTHHVAPSVHSTHTVRTTGVHITGATHTLHRTNIHGLGTSFHVRSAHGRNFLFNRCFVRGRDCYCCYLDYCNCYVYWWPGAPCYYYLTAAGFAPVTAGFPGVAPVTGPVAGPIGGPVGGPVGGPIPGPVTDPGTTGPVPGDTGLPPLPGDGGAPPVDGAAPVAP
ncbi:MAG: hypothetical protein U0793_29390 [Gemmataceae bacterium]